MAIHFTPRPDASQGQRGPSAVWIEPWVRKPNVHLRASHSLPGPFLALPPPLLLSSWSPLPAFPLRSADSRGLCSACLLQTQRRQGSPAQPPRGPHTADRPYTAQGTADLALLQGRPSKIVAPSPCCPEATREVTGRQVGGGLGLRVSPRRAMMPSCPWQQLPSYPGHPHFCMEAEPLSSAPKPGISTHFQQTL